MFGTGVMNLLLGILLVYSAITKWKWMGSMADRFPMVESDIYRIIVGIAGVLVAILGLFMMFNA
ncbi:MAG TPA: hypothetical protein DDX71_03190 [Ruminococcus sp.]|nr:hypothetical protein [Ruminococcus sp.]